MSSPAFLPIDSIPFFSSGKEKQTRTQQQQKHQILQIVLLLISFCISYEKLNAGKLIGILHYKKCNGVERKSHILKGRKIENYHRYSNFVEKKKQLLNP